LVAAPRAFLDVLAFRANANGGHRPAGDGQPIIDASDAFLELCGYARDEVLGQNYSLLMGKHAASAVA
jgi:PAS domain-containing protein